MMEQRQVNVLLTTFAGLGLPRTLSLPTEAHTSVGQVLSSIYERLPCPTRSLIVTTTSNKQLSHADDAPISDLLSSRHDTILPLRLSSRLCGGKGGFGSQLRAAGGRMSSRKKRSQQNQGPQNGSNRNLDGRRLRTVDAAKNLADYLAKKPDAESKEKEEQRKRWEATVEAAEATAEKIKSGKMGSGQGRLDAEYVESKELAEEKTREAVLKAMREGILTNERTGSESSLEAGSDESEDDDEGEEENSGSSEVVEVDTGDGGGRTFFGWDDEDGDEVSDEDDVPAADAEPPQSYEGKGKGRAV